MSLVVFIFLTGLARAESSQIDVSQACVRVAHQYAIDHGGQPWSEDATYVRSIHNTCLVRVSQTCDFPPFDRYGKTYVIDMATWAVLYFEVDGCVNGP